MAHPETSITLEDVPDAVARVGPDGRIVAANERARQLLAGAGEAGPGGDWIHLLLEEDAARFGRFIAGLGVGASARQDFQFGPRHHPIKLTVHARRLAAGFACSLQKTDAERAGPPIFVGPSEVWLPANFLSRLTHQLKTHVATSQAASFLLRSHGKELEGPREQKWMNAIRESVVSLGTMLEQMDALERVVIGATVQGPEPLHVPAWLEMIADRARKAAPGATAALTIKPGVTGRWWFGEMLLGTALECLLVNTLKFAPVDGRATLQVTEAGPWFEIVVADDGSGVAPADIERLFTPFFRGQNARHLPGCGLGLAIARAAVTRLGGAVQYVPRPDGGTEFHVRVPARPER